MAEQPQPTPPPSRPPWRWWLLAIAAAWLVFLLLSPWPARDSFEIPYTEFKTLLRQGQISEITLRGNVVSGTLHQAQPLGPQGQSATRFSTRLPALDDPGLLPALEAQGVKIQVQEGTGQAGWLPMLLAMLPWVILLSLFYFGMRQAYRNIPGGMGGDLRGFLKSPVKKGEIPKVTFADVAGQDNAKREVTELVEFLRQPEHFRQLGAEVPRGVLLMGPPGTGKTLLAKALAGEAGVPFFSISGSEFIEVFVGVGASRVRNLFEEARKSTPCIIFIDELDAVGRTRGTGLGGGHDEREQTLNQILAELDGFSGREAIIVLAATNRPDVLDPALLRPGRFDRHVTLDLPDRNDRKAILGVHTRKVPLGADIDLAKIAAGTPGFSGADLKNLVNEAAMLAARERATQVQQNHFDEARDKLLLGTARVLAILPEEKHRLAVHEAGHTLVAYYLPHADPPYKVSIIPRGQALGGTQQMPEAERHTLPEDYLRDRLAVILGGRAAEQSLLGTVSSGADDDIRQATTLARAMVGRWGMSKEVGPVDLRDSEEHPFLGREIAQPRRFSESSAEVVDKAVRQLLLEAEQRALTLIQNRKQPLLRLIALLEEQETLDRDHIATCLGSRKLELTSTGQEA